MSWQIFVAGVIGYLWGWWLEHHRVAKITAEMEVTIDELQKIIEDVRRENELAWKYSDSLTDRLADRMGIK